MTLRYPGAASLNLRTETPHQEVLLLQSDVRDTWGGVVVPAGTVVIGRFETSSAGSRFITQAISINGRNIPLIAQSEVMGGNRRVSNNQLLRNSGIGAIAGGLIGGFSGLGFLGGAATGAAVTYFTSPKPATLQPEQTVQVRVLEDVRLN